MKTSKQILVASVGDVSKKGNISLGVSIRKGFAKKPAYILTDEAGIADLVEALKLDDPSKLIGSDITSMCEGFEETVSTFVGDDGAERSYTWLEP